MAVTDQLLGLSGGVAVKAPVLCVSTTNITLSGTTQIFDGITPTTGERVLVWRQDSSGDNGIWTVQSSSWARAKDFDGSKDVVRGTAVYISTGSGFGGTFFFVNSTGDNKPGTNIINFAQSAVLATPTQVTVSTFMETFVGLSTGTTARDYLGAMKMPMTTRGDLVTSSGDTSTAIRLAIGAANTALHSDGNDLVWRFGLASNFIRDESTSLTLSATNSGAVISYLGITTASWALPTTPPAGTRYIIRKTQVAAVLTVTATAGLITHSSLFTSSQVTLTGAADYIGLVYETSDQSGVNAGWFSFAEKRTFTSSPTTFAVLSTDSFVHSLGVVPRIYSVTMQNVTASAGISTGTEILLANTVMAASTGVTIMANSSSIIVRTGGAIAILSSTGATTSITSTNWRLIARAQA